MCFVGRSLLHSILFALFIPKSAVSSTDTNVWLMDNRRLALQFTNALRIVIPTMIQAAQFHAIIHYQQIDENKYSVTVNTDNGVKNLIIDYCNPIQTIE